MKYKIFCDESCHLEFDKTNILVLGAICCEEEQVVAINKHIKYLRNKHNYHNELKWTKLVKTQKEFYKELIEYFFSNSSMRFKTTTVINKSRLNHKEFNQGSHQNFYYKMFFYTLRDFIQHENKYKIYLDYMDTLGRDKAKKLQEVLVNNSYNQSDIDIYIIASRESQIIQLTDLFIGAMGYVNREDLEKKESEIKNFIIDEIQRHINHSLCNGTPPWEEKFNIFKFSPKVSNV